MSLKPDDMKQITTTVLAQPKPSNNKMPHLQRMRPERHSISYKNKKNMLRCDTMSSSQEPLVLFGGDDERVQNAVIIFFLKKVTIVCRQRSIRRKIFPHEQRLRQARDLCELSQPLQFTLRQPLAPIHKQPQSQ